MAAPHEWAVVRLVRRFLSRRVSRLDRVVTCEKCGNSFNVDLARMHRRNTDVVTCPRLLCRHRNRLPLTNLERAIQEGLDRDDR